VLVDKRDIPIASTRLRYKGEEVLISLHLPQPAFENTDQYVCSFSIMGGELDYTGKSIGFDSMQSLILSLMKIGTYLTRSESIDVSKIDWEGGSLEFPVFRNV
jgi:hypothetical protein